MAFELHIGCGRTTTSSYYPLYKEPGRLPAAFMRENDVPGRLLRPRLALRMYQRSERRPQPGTR